MNIFISADIEGSAATARWEDCSPGNPTYASACEQMLKEVLSVCEGARAGGAETIFVRDAHGPATNLDPTRLPAHVTLMRRWSDHPLNMVEGLNPHFDAAFFVGYHCAAGQEGGPLAHTISTRPLYVRLNGEICSEFTLYSYAASYVGVPVLFLAGDRLLCEEAQKKHPALVTVPVKDSFGYSVITPSAEAVLANMRAGAEEAMRRIPGAVPFPLPEFFSMEICFKEACYAQKTAFYPGMKKKDANTLVFETSDYFEILRMVNFVL